MCELKNCYLKMYSQTLVSKSTNNKKDILTDMNKKSFLQNAAIIYFTVCLCITKNEIVST